MRTMLGAVHGILIILLLRCRLCKATSVNCTAAPDCAALRRQGCDEQQGLIVDNRCGDCLADTFGGPGPSTTRCLETDACAMIFSGTETCPATNDASILGEAFVIGFNLCQCDTDGLQWPTAPNSCVKLEVNSIGNFQMWQCSDPTCAPASCLTLATWSPLEATFGCQTRGGDAFLLNESCQLATRSQQDICGHPGFVTSNPGSSFGSDCEVAPLCPHSVLETRLEESCCSGTHLSNVIQNGVVQDEQAPGFCTRDGASCAVLLNGPGWRGCACLDEDGATQYNYVCTLECSAPDCVAPDSGVPATPTSWQTSEVPAVLLNGGRVASGAFGLRSSSTLLLAELTFLLVGLVLLILPHPR